MSEIPHEFLKELETAKRERELASDLIRHYTTKWLTAQQKYIEMLEFIDGKMEEKKC